MLVGDISNIAHVMASQYLKRGLNVSILTTDFEHTVNTLTSIADGSADFHGKRIKGYITSSGCNSANLRCIPKLLSKTTRKR